MTVRGTCSGHARLRGVPAIAAALAQAHQRVRHKRGAMERVHHARHRSAATSVGLSLTTSAQASRPMRGIGFAVRWGMANQARQLEAASIKQNRKPRLAEVKEIKERPPLKPVPPPDEDVLCYLPIG